ncbi:SCO family protein [Risungbinella massiliensis]|uniref:SCO family protein n=1 Tax=Risungbinella massiliensis TaxID=1329796 RepID=UPI000699BF5C|nr:SCO family protein [Risungbinella massiliensis]
MKKWKKGFVALLSCFFIVLVGCNQTAHDHSSGEKEMQVTSHESASMTHQSFQPTATLGSQVKDFRFTDQEGKEFGLQDLKGKVWVADFIFTRCTHICPLTMPIKVKLDQELRKKGLDVPFVSFTVEPDHDSPVVLKDFAKKYSDDLHKSHYLTGYSFEQIQKFAKSSFGQELIQMDSGVKHGRSFYIIDTSGKVVKEFDGTEPDYHHMLQEIQSVPTS